MLFRIIKIFALLFAFTVFAPPQSHAQNPRKIVEREDTNGYNKVSREEFRGRPGNFVKIDQNGDGFLTVKEFKVFFDSRSGGGGGRKAGGSKNALSPAKIAGYSGRIINTHAQYDQTIGTDEIVAILKQATVSKVIISGRGKRSNADILAAAEKYPGMIFPSAKTKYGFYLEGHGKWNEYLWEVSGNSKFIAMQELLLHHAEKISPSGKKLAPEMIVDTDSSQVQEAVFLSVKRKWPVVLHYEFAVLEPDRRKRFINDLETLLKKHPGHPFALMHMGLLSTGEVRKLIEAHKNVYFQLSMAANIYRETGYPWTFMFEENGAIGELRPEWKDILTEHPKRFLFAMDGVFANQWRKRSVQDIREWRAALGSIPQEAADLIAHKNAERLWSGLIR